MNNLKEPLHDETFDIRDLLFKLSGYWYWFVITLFISITISYIINRITPTVYDVRTSILVQDEKKMLDERFSSGLEIYNSGNRLPNEIAILKTRTLVKRTIQRLNVRVAYFSVSRFKTTELYNQTPFIITTDTNSYLPLLQNVEIKILSANQYSLRIQSNQTAIYSCKENLVVGYLPNAIDTVGNIFTPMIYKGIKFSLIPQQLKDFKPLIGQKFSFVVNDDNTLVGQFKGYSVSENKAASILTISMSGYNVQKMVDFLNTLTKVYMEKGMEKKNLMAENTIRFIDSQLGDVGDSLFRSEKTLQDYRISHNVMDVDMQVQQNFTSIENLKEKRAELIVSSKYFAYLKHYLETNNDIKDLASPSALNINDAVLNNLINDLIALYNERSELTFNSKKENPFLLSNAQKINSVKESVIKTINNLLNANKISIQELDLTLGEMTEKVNKLPETQRKLIGYERKFKLNDALYTYLLTKRSEIQIAKSSYLPDNEILDEATALEARPIAPNKRKNIFIAIILGLGVPLAFILLKNYLNFKILSNEDIEANTKFPILGHILRSKEKTQTVVADFPMSLTSESIRAIRTNMQFLASEKEKHVVLVTSSIMNEGKSFTAINIGLSFAMYSKKTVILNFDMRKPKIHEYLNLDPEKGLSHYLSRNAELDEVICKTKFEHLDAILAGSIPPNPMELIAGERTKTLIAELKNLYDYIIIDTPPLGMVADALLLLKYTDVNLYVVRYNHTYKKTLAQVTENLKKRGIANFNIILNDVHLKRTRLPYAYYSYSYGYGYGYYANENAPDKKK